ncbi:serine/threonine protein kinase [Thermophilibacter sp. ET337]|uniref:serine/threonine protein kinase n=1 Tax=Thermophilibacter sp. ET337 TaxID=2973084 RepID=UPI0021ABC3E7|nr:serine/threonine-protein kinase [Thermophilibacter sp. ET337]MCR8908190.1 serine/threonine protein kinase [Thermophilibacter sp. ET337]
MHAMDLDDAYRVDRVLARGTGGVTEIVTLGESGPFVRKRIPSKLARRGVWGTLAECDCARLPHVIATYEMPDEFVVVCDFVPGENLEQLLSARGRLAEKDAARLVLQLCEAATALHTHGIIHRDISPTNVIVAADGAHLIDLGIARFRAEGATHDTTQLGTPGFASPEQYGFAQTDARSDVYSLGRVLGYLLTGTQPGVPDAADYERSLEDEKVVSPRMRAIIERACALEPSARYQSAEELAGVLEGREPPESGGAAARPEEPLAPSSPEEPPPRPAASGGRRGPSFAQVIVGALAVIALLAAIVLIMHDAGVFRSGAATGDHSASRAQPQSSRQDQALEPDDSAGAPVAAPTTSEESPLEVVESGWSVDDQGFVHYGIALRNTGDAVVEYPAYTVTGRDDSGAVLFSQEQVLSSIGAGETIWWGGLAGNPGQPPATVEFSANGVEDYQVGSGAERSATFAVSGARPVSDGLGGTNFVGEVTCERDDGSDVGSDVALSVLLRDEDGSIVFGAVGFASRPEVGSTTTFEVSCHTVPDYASYEVHALAW